MLSNSIHYTQCLNGINLWLYGANSDVSYAKPSLAINSSAVNARDTNLYISIRQWSVFV